MRKKIMVPLGPRIRDLKSVHYALAAAERLDGEVILLRLEDGFERRYPWLEEALTDLIASARLAGLSLTLVEADASPVREIVELAFGERVDLLVFSEDQKQLERRVMARAPELGHKMIQVQGKEHENIDWGGG